MNNWLVEVVLEVGKVREWSVPSVEERFYLRMDSKGQFVW